MDTDNNDEVLIDAVAWAILVVDPRTLAAAEVGPDSTEKAVDCKDDTVKGITRSLDCWLPELMSNSTELVEPRNGS